MDLFLGDQMEEKTRGTAGGLSCPLSDHPPFSSLAASAPRGHNAAFPGPPRLSWMLLSCLMLLSQVQGEISLPPALGSQCPLRAKARRKAPVLPLVMGCPHTA